MRKLKELVHGILDEIANMILNAADGNEDVFEEIMKNLQEEHLKEHEGRY